MNLYSHLKEKAGWNPEHLFLRDLQNQRDYTFQELDQWTARLAHQLRSRLGVRPGDRVASQVEKSPQAFFLYLACLRAGAIYLPLNTAYPAAEIEYFLSDALPRIFICDPERKKSLKRICDSLDVLPVTLDRHGKGELLQDLEAQPAEFDTLPTREKDLAAILYTSGTTGRSKGAMLSHGNLSSNALTLAHAWGFSKQDRLLHALPIFHVHGLFISLNCALASGASVLWLPKFDADQVVEHLENATVFMGVPTYYTRLLDNTDLNGELAANMRLFVSGSAPLRPETFAAFENRTGHRILERYGMTETGINTSNPLNSLRIPGTVGLPLEEIELRLAPDTGMIEVRGPNVFQGYWNQPEKTQAEFRPDGFFKTGDLGCIDENGYLKIIGRAKDLIISGGLNVYPKEIEIILDSLPDVEESAVFGVEHPDFGEAVVAAVVPSRDAKKAEVLDEKTILQEARSRLAAFKSPKRVFFLDELPRNTMGKVQKAVLRERFSATFVSANTKSPQT